MKINNFEELEIWELGRELYKRVFEISLIDPFNKDFRLRDQMRASSGSVPDNIAEGFERGGNKEFIQFLFIAKGFAGEVRSQSYRAYDSKYIDEETLNELLEKTSKITAKTVNLIKYLKETDKKGVKYD